MVSDVLQGMKGAASAALLVGVAAMAAGCGGDPGEAVWALNYATVTPAENGTVSGTHVWTFYDEDWDLEDEGYICAVVQHLEGVEMAAPEDCPAARAAYSVTLSFIESDCPAGIQADEWLVSGVDNFCVGRLSDDVLDVVEHPDESMGWYFQKSGGAATSHGSVYLEELDWADADDVAEPHKEWEPGRRYRLAPAFAWTL